MLGFVLLVSCFGTASAVGAARPVFSLDPGEGADWTCGGPSGTTVTATVGESEGRRTLRMEYTYPTGQFVETARPFPLEAQDYGDVVFWWRGTRHGATFELKFMDGDGTVFGIKYPTTSLVPGKWTKVTIPWSELGVLWGGNLQLDRIEKIGFALSGLGGAGVVEIAGFHSESIDGLRVAVDVNQVGYHPGSRKEFVVRVTGNSAPAASRRSFWVRDDESGAVVFRGEATRQDFNDWPGTFYLGDFSNLRREGRYVVEDSSSARSRPFEIGARVLTARTAPLEFAFLKAMHCGERCHTNTPLRGGYHDTRFDISQRMWAIPHVVLGIKEYAEHNPTGDALEELAYGAEFCARFPEPDGTVSWSGIESDFQKAGLTIEQWLARLGPLKPEDDQFERKKYTEPSFHATCFNLVAVMEALPLLRERSSHLVEPVMQTLHNSWAWIDRQPLRLAHDYGCYLDAATAAYRATHDRKYLRRVPEVLPKLLALQALDASRMERGACGDFYLSADQRHFAWHYKYTSFNIGINRALLRLADILAPDDPLYGPVCYANEVFTRTYLRQMAGKTPYRQLADNLEPDGTGKFKMYYFAGQKAAPAAAGDHGLNCDHFALGWVALKWAQQTGDFSLQELAEDQIHWALGKNPFGFCMLMGAGTKNPVTVADFWNKTLPGAIINGPSSPDGQSLQYRPDHFGHSEEWIPHNGDYLRLLGNLESPATLRGRVLRRGEPVANAGIRISKGAAVLFRGKTDLAAKWKSVPLPPGRDYIVQISQGWFGDRISYRLDLPAGTDKTITTHLDRHYSIQIEQPTLTPDQPAILHVTLKNQSRKAVTPRLRAYVRGAAVKSEPTGTLSIPARKEIGVTYELLPDRTEPFFFLVMDEDDPQIAARCPGNP